jgi:hypothetical protein
MAKIALIDNSGASDAAFTSPYTTQQGDLRAVRPLGDGSVLVGGDVLLTSPNQRYLQRIQITAGSSGGDGGNQSFADWKASQHFTVGVNDAPEQDADNDGLSNLVEFALGTDPLSASASQKPHSLDIQNNGETHAGIQFTRNKNASGVRIEITASNSVTANSNETVEESVEDLGNGIERVTVRSTRPLAQVSQLFFVVRVATN